MWPVEIIKAIKSLYLDILVNSDRDGISFILNYFEPQNLIGTLKYVNSHLTC